ncbi:MAG: sugar phosphate isomerase/epimerase [Acidobacteria bacterium]|nr:sugar phosphate isomerase/epimerase [Acidobacteriota bacterium]
MRFRTRSLTRRQFLTGMTLATAAGAAPRRWLVGANTAVKGLELHRAVALLGALRFPVIEIHPMGKPEPAPADFPGFEFDSMAAVDRTRLKKALRPFRHVTTHLPYTGLDYFAADPAVADRAWRRVEIALEGSVYFGASIAVFHPKQGGGQTLQTQWPLMLRRVRELGDQARKHGMRIALETGFPLSVADFTRLIREADHPAVGATIDVGHQGRYAELVARVPASERATPAGIRAYNDTTIAIAEALGRKVFHLHVHDIDPATWQEHRPMGTGFVDYPRLFHALRRIGYDGHLVLEIAGDPAAMEGHLRQGKAAIEGYLAGMG